MSYEIRHSNGTTETHDTYAEAIAAVALRYEQCEIGHDGDLTSGGDRTLCWATEADSIDDDGARAVASICRRYTAREDAEDRAACDAEERYEQQLEASRED